MAGRGLVKETVDEREQGVAGGDPTVEVENDFYAYCGFCCFRSGALDCWEVAGIRVEQGEDGLVRVERLNR